MIGWWKHDFCRRRTSCPSVSIIISKRDFSSITRFRNDDYFPLKTWSENRFFNFHTVFLEIYRFIFYKIWYMIAHGPDKHYEAVCQKRFGSCHFFVRWQCEKHGFPSFHHIEKWKKSQWWDDLFLIWPLCFCTTVTHNYKDETLEPRGYKSASTNHLYNHVTSCL